MEFENPMNGNVANTEVEKYIAIVWMNNVKNETHVHVRIVLNWTLKTESRRVWTRSYTRFRVRSSSGF
jgi:hypothetical protein